MSGNGVLIKAGGKVEVQSTGNFLVNTANVTIDSNDINQDNTIFELKGIWSGNGTTTGTFLRMNKEYGGFFAGWNFNLGWIWSGDGTTCVTLCGTNTVSPSLGNKYTSETYDYVKNWAIYAGANWPETTPSGSGSGWAPFRVKRNGELYAHKICLGYGPNGTQTYSNNT